MGFLLGISAYYHDSAAVLLKDGQLLFAAQEERFSRKKSDPRFPAQAIAWCLAEAGIELSQLAAIAFYDKPLLKLERILETFLAATPRGLTTFARTMPVWAKEKLLLRATLERELGQLGDLPGQGKNLLFPEHHLSHAASAFYPSPFNSAAILTIDGVGEWATSQISRGKGKEIERLSVQDFPHSWGLFYSALTAYLGFKVNSGEYKVMGLAPYGDADAQQTKRFRELLCSEFAQVGDDGGIWLDQRYFSFTDERSMLNLALSEQTLGIPPRVPETELQPEHANLALACQQVLQDGILKMARTAKALTSERHLCLAGGVALNCVANAAILRENIFEDIFIQPAAGDAGGALGAALAAWHLHFEGPRNLPACRDGMSAAYLGPSYGENDLDHLQLHYGAVSRAFADDSTLVEAVADLLLHDPLVVGWFQGRMEWGPRALCHRSILGDPRSPEMQKTLNLKIKFRESFRPFAPVILEEEASRVFDISCPSPYMLLVAQLRQDYRLPVPSNYTALSIREKLATPISQFPAVTHADFSARLQTISRQDNPRFALLLDQIKARTGVGMLVNTSFNVRGEPIVCSPEEAYRCFMTTDMDALVLERRLYLKAEQPAGHLARVAFDKD